jgi:hypothetical protein
VSIAIKEEKVIITSGVIVDFLKVPPSPLGLHSGFQ